MGKKGNFYIYDTKTGYYHLDDSYCVKKIRALYPSRPLKEVKNIQDKHQICKTCRRKLYIKLGAEDFEKKEKEYLDLFSKHSIGDGLLSRFYFEKKFRTQLRGDTLYVTGQYDDWKIVFVYDGKIELWHNNYTKDDHGNRTFTNGYHEHEKNYDNLTDVLMEVIKYRYSPVHKWDGSHATYNQSQSITEYTKQLIRKSKEKEGLSELLGNE